MGTSHASFMPRTSLAPHTSRLKPRASRLAAPHLTPRASCLTPRARHLTPQASRHSLSETWKKNGILGSNRSMLARATARGVWVNFYTLLVILVAGAVTPRDCALRVTSHSKCDCGVRRKRSKTRNSQLVMFVLEFTSYYGEGGSSVSMPNFSKWKGCTRNQFNETKARESRE